MKDQRLSVDGYSDKKRDIFPDPNRVTSECQYESNKRGTSNPSTL